LRDVAWRAILLKDPTEVTMLPVKFLGESKCFYILNRQFDVDCPLKGQRALLESIPITPNNLKEGSIETVRRLVFSIFSHIDTRYIVCRLQGPNEIH
jgi:hypothetical protein